MLPTCQRYGMGVLTWSPLASGFLTGAYRKGRPIDMTTGRPALHPARFDPALPENAAKLEVVEQLVEVADDLGRALPELAIAFPLAHPAVTSMIVCPRTQEQLDTLSAGADLTLDDATLDRIDAIVPPGTDRYRADGVWRPVSLTDPTQRRRPVAGAGAGWPNSGDQVPGRGQRPGAGAAGDGRRTDFWSLGSGALQVRSLAGSLPVVRYAVVVLSAHEPEP